MELSSSDKERIQHQYDALAKKTLVGEAKSHRRTLAKRAAREVTFSDLSESELAQLFTTDEYESDYFRFQVSGFDVLVKNELLAEALNALPERKRDIILLRDNSVRRRIKAYRTFASLDRGVNVGASKRKLGSRVKLTAFSG